MQYYTIKGTELGRDVYVEPAKEFKNETTDKPKVYLNFKLLNGYAKIIERKEQTIKVEV